MNTAPITLIVLIIISFVLASMLNVYPLGPTLAMVRPMFLMMVLFFWVMYEPRVVGMGVAFVVGLFADMLMDTHLGHQAFCAVLTVFGIKLVLLESKRMSLSFLCGLGMAGLIAFCAMLWVLQSVAYTKLVFTGFGSLVISLLLFAPMAAVFASLAQRLGVPLEKHH